jgi:hypothetical protein
VSFPVVFAVGVGLPTVKNDFPGLPFGNPVTYAIRDTVDVSLTMSKGKSKADELKV